MPDEFAASLSIAILGVPAAAWVAVRMMEHLERMEMIRRGMVPSVYHVVQQVQTPSIDACMQVSRGIMLGVMAIILLAGLSFVISADDVLLPKPAWAHGTILLAALFGLVFFVRSMTSRRLRPKTIRDAGASLKLPY